MNAPSRIARICSLALAISVAACSGKPEAGKGPGKGGDRPSVLPLATVVVGDAVVTRSTLAQVQASQRVAVSPDVGGRILAQHFAEGDAITKGQRLFTLDDADLQIALAAAEASAAREQANLSAAKLQLERLRPLLAAGYVTPQEVDAADAATQQANAALALARSSLTQARLNLSRAVVTAPAAGLAGAVSKQVGNFAAARETLVTLERISPAELVMSLPPDDLAAVQLAMAKGSVAVVAKEQSDNAVIAQGAVSFLDPSLDANNGTVRLKAVFDNRDQALWPGRFVNADLVLAREPNQLLVPEGAVQPGIAGASVMLRGPDQRVKPATVTAGTVFDGKVVILKGLSAGDVVLAQIPRDLKPGSKVLSPQEAAAQKPGGSTGVRPTTQGGASGATP